MIGPDRRVDVFLVGSQYSGTTHLGGLLAANLGAAYLGEMAHLPRFVKEYELYDEPIGCLLCGDADKPCPVWTPDVIDQAEDAGPAGSMDVLRRRTHSTVVVDGSKMPQWLRAAAADRPPAAARVAVILTVRSPLRYVLSAAGATGLPAWRMAQSWRDIYWDALRTISAAGAPMLVVQNEHVRTRPLQILASIAAFIGRKPPRRLRPSAPTHSIAGNLWVQRGYSPQTGALQRKLGLRSDENSPSSEQWAAVAARATMTELGRPKTHQAALELAQTILDCPGLSDIAHMLGYHMAVNIDKLIAQATN